MRLFKIEIGRPQQLAGVLLLMLLAQCLWVVNRQEISARDYRFARCGREMWERPSPLAGYFTTCGNLNGDGTFAYRVAGLPLTLERITLLAGDKLRKPENRLYASGSLNGSTWEARHELSGVKYLLHLPFVLFALWLGAGLWWVSRRMFGNEGAFFALGLYCFSPAILRSAVTPNNDVLAMWGLYGLVYTAIGVAHAMQGPRKKWRPRIVLLTVALGLTAAAHLLAAMVGSVVALILMLYLAERRRSYVMQIFIYAALGAMAILFAFYAFRPAAFSYVFTGGGGRFWFTLENVQRLISTPANWPTVIATLVAVGLYLGIRRSRYFGNTVPLVMTLLLLPLMTTQTVTAPWLWALPFLFTFVGGVFADALETRQRRMFLALTGVLLTAQAALCVLVLPGIAR
jgi:hypothetical protein